MLMAVRKEMDEMRCMLYSESGLLNGNSAELTVVHGGA